MNLKLASLNALLIVFIAAAWRHMQVESARAQRSERRILAGRSQPDSAAPAMIPVASSSNRLVPTDYIAIVRQNLFAKDRNPTVAVEQPVSPPPQPAMPALPILRGILEIDAGGPIALLSERADAPTRELRRGDSIGPFKLLAVSTREIAFLWNGEAAHFTLDELRAYAQLRMVDPPPIPDPKHRACYPGDPTPAGTIIDGFRKIEWETPFGHACVWELVDRK